MKHVVVILLFFLFPLLAEAQLKEVWKASQKLPANEHIHNAIEATNGTIFAVGYTESTSGKKRDGLVIILDTRSGQIIRPKNIGGKFNEEFRSITQTNEGHFVMAGYTGTNTNGKKDGWLVCINEKGDKLWEKNFGTPGDDEFEEVVYNPESKKITAIGYKNNRASGDIWLLQLDGDKTVVDKEFGRREYENVKGAVINKAGEIAIAGNRMKPRGKVFTLLVDADGNERWNHIYYNADNNSEVAEDLTLTSSNQFLLTGSTISRADGENMWAVLIDKYGNELWSEEYGGNDHDAAMSATQALDGGFYLVGRTLSHKSNSRAERIYLVKIDDGGKREYQKDYGGSKVDIGRVALQLNNGMIFLASDSESDGAQRKDGLFMAFRSEEDRLPDFRAMKSSVKLVRIDEQVTLNTYDQLIKPNDRSSVAVTIHNESEIALPNLSIRVDNSGAKGVNAWQDNYIGKLEPNESRIVHIPVQAAESMESGEHLFGMTVMAGTTTLESSKFSLEGKVASPAKLELYDSQAELVSSTRGAGEVIKLTMTFVNEGDFSTQNAKIIPQMPSGIQGLPAQSNLKLGTVSPSGQRKVFYTFKPDANYLKSRRDATLTFQIENNGSTNQAPVRITIDNLENPSASGGGFGNKPVVLWAEPNLGGNKSNRFQTSDPNAKIRVTIASKQKLRVQDIKVYRNKNIIEGNKNFAEEELTAPGGSYAEASYSRKIQLDEGINEIYVQAGDGESQKIVIEYLPRSRNLHVLAIGPQHPDLKYTSKDAKDFAEAFRNQKGKLFNEVYVTELATPEETTQLNIVKAMLDLERKYKDELILPNDVVILFISSHGVIGTGNRYKIIPSGFDPAYGDRFTIDYKDDILGPLSRIDCKKMIFIDACHSGAASAKGPFKDQRRSEMIFRLNAQSPGLSSIVSCKSSEMSYEDDARGNGAFTEAIVEALDNTSIRDDDGTTYKVSIDDDFITLGELYRFVRRRVSSLVNAYKPDAPTKQTPELIGAENEALDDNLPLYEITKNN